MAYHHALSRRSTGPPPSAPSPVRTSRRFTAEGGLPPYPPVPGYLCPAFPGLICEVQHDGSWYQAVVEGVVRGSSVFPDLKLAYLSPGERRTGVFIPWADVPERVRLSPDVRQRLLAHQALDVCVAQLSLRASRLSARREAAMDAAVREAARRAAADPELLRVRSAVSGPVGPHEYLLWDYFSGPFGSMSQTAALHFANVRVLSLDWDRRCRADLHVDLGRWCPWAYLLGRGDEGMCAGAGVPTSIVDGCVRLPDHVHFSPPCFTYGVASGTHGRKVGKWAGAGSSVYSLASDTAVAAAVHFVRGLHQSGAPTTFTWENPSGSLLWLLPAVAALVRDGILVKTTTCYCMHGREGVKPTDIYCSPELCGAVAEEGKRPGIGQAYVAPWGRMCTRDGGCGSMGVSGKHLGPGSYSLRDCALPTALCGDIHRAWLRHHGRLRVATRGCVCELPCAAVHQLLLTWRQQTFCPLSPVGLLSMLGLRDVMCGRVRLGFLDPPSGPPAPFPCYLCDFDGPVAAGVVDGPLNQRHAVFRSAEAACRHALSAHGSSVGGLAVERQSLVQLPVLSRRELGSLLDWGQSQGEGEAV